MAQYETAAQVISKAARQLGLSTADIADPFSSTSANVLLLVQLLGDLGQELAASHEWSRLKSEATIALTGAASYALPADFGGMVPQSTWNRTQQHPSPGPLSSQLWQYRKATTVASTLSAEFRLWQNLVHILPTTTTGQTIAYEYRSLYWVSLTAVTTLSKDAPTVASDILYFKPLLLVRGLKLWFRRATGFDTTGFQEDFDAALELAKSEEPPGEILSLDGARDGVRMADWSNVPDTGYGS